MAIHIMLQGKGGVGKSMISSMLAQCYIEQNIPTLCIDTDPVNATFSSFSGFETTHIKLLKGNNIDQRALDDLMQVAAENPDKTIIIDNGASSFIPLSAYIIENDAISMLKEMGHEIFIHTVITGGQALLDTVTGFSSIVTQFSDDAKVVVWLNEYFGEIESDGKHISELDVFKKNKKNVAGLITIPEQSELFAGDVKRMLEKHLTFNEVKLDTSFQFMEKHRIERFRKELFASVIKSLKIPKVETAEA